MKKRIALLLTAALVSAVFHLALLAQEVIPSATGVGYGGSGGFDANASWLTPYDAASGKSGTAIRVYPAPFVSADRAPRLADLSLRYRYLPFALYLFPDHMKSYESDPVHSNMHYSSASRDISYSVLSAFDMESPGLITAFKHLYDTGLRRWEENLFIKRMLELSIGGKDFKQDWSATSEPRLVKEFFFSEEVPLAGFWQDEFSDWSEANLQLIEDYCAAATYASMMLPSFVPGSSGGGSWYTPTGNPMLYDLPSNSFSSAPVTVAYQQLYNEMMAVFNDPSYELSWALVFEPIANYYPVGHTDLRAWSSPSDIAQVLAEKAWEDSDLYKIGHEVLGYAASDLIKPLDGNYARYYAQLFYQLRNTSIFDNFIFRQTRAIFTNNYSGSDYLPDQFLLADTLRPEINNEDGFLGGWAIVYLRDLINRSPKVDALRYGLLIEQKDLGASGETYGNLATFSSAPPSTMMKWYQQPGGSEIEAIMDYLPGASSLLVNTSFLSASLSVNGLATYKGLYTATQEIVLNDAWLSASFGKNDLSPDPDSLDFTLLEVVEHPVSANVFGTAKYEAPESSVRTFLEASGQLILEKIRAVSEASGATLHRSASEVASSLTLRPLSAVHEGESGVDFTFRYLHSPSSFTSSVVKDASGIPQNSAHDGKPLLSINGTIPITYALKLPDYSVMARIITMHLNTPTDSVEEIPFDIAEIMEYTPSDCPAVVLGWLSSTAVIDSSALRAAAASLSVHPTSSDLATLQAAFSADKALLIDCGDLIQVAATEITPGIYDGATVVVIIPEDDTVDLIFNPLDLQLNSTLTRVNVGMWVENVSTRTITTRINLSARDMSTGATQRFTLPVTLSPGLTLAEQSVNLPSEGTIFFQAEVNPLPRDVDEINYSNNIASEYLTIPTPPVIDPFDPTCVSSFAWVERRSHTWTCYPQPPPGGWPPGMMCIDPYYYYCVHEYRYRITLTPSLTYDYRYEGVEFDDADTLHAIKSGYGFTPKLSIACSGIELLSERVVLGNNCAYYNDPTEPCRASAAPSNLSQASITLPTTAYLSWYGGWRGMGHSPDDYTVYNPEKMTAQYYYGIPFELVDDDYDLSGPSTLEFLPAHNPVSDTELQRVYLNVNLRDGNHDFRVDISGGSIAYRVNWPSYRYRLVSYPWSICRVTEAEEISYMDPSLYPYLEFDQCLGLSIDGRVRINGNMYEDDFSGAWW